jgi:hypothetical protein
MLSDMFLGIVTAFCDGAFVLSPLNDMKDAARPGTFNPHVCEPGVAFQSLSRIFRGSQRGKRSIATAAHSANGNGEQKLTVTAADRNRKIQKPRFIQSRCVPCPIHRETRCAPPPLHSADRLGARHGFGFLNRSDDELFFSGPAQWAHRLGALQFREPHENLRIQK